MIQFGAGAYTSLPRDTRSVLRYRAYAVTVVATVEVPLQSRQMI